MRIIRMKYIYFIIFLLEPLRYFWCLGIKNSKIQRSNKFVKVAMLSRKWSPCEVKVSVHVKRCSSKYANNLPKLSERALFHGVLIIPHRILNDLVRKDTSLWYKYLLIAMSMLPSCSMYTLAMPMPSLNVSDSFIHPTVAVWQVIKQSFTLLQNF